MFFLQIDPTGIIEAASEVRPGEGSGYGWLISVMMVIVAALGYVIYLLWQENKEERGKKDILHEKSLDVHRASTDAIGDLSDKVNEVVMEQKIHTALLQQNNGNR